MWGTASLCPCREDGAVAVNVESSMNDDSYCEAFAVSVSCEDKHPSSASTSTKRFRLGIFNNGDWSSVVENTMSTWFICKVNTQRTHISLLLTAECVVRIRRRHVIAATHHPPPELCLFCATHHIKLFCSFRVVSSSTQSATAGRSGCEDDANADDNTKSD